ncbi:hypothetical protein ACIBW9_36995 [Streptomyces sp. NPDC049541]|uniref:hypothetical protein n=1 Tax=Streptomyces sp. NPDC049541 TaxID=3365594 RepID=UPI0037AD84FB
MIEEPGVAGVSGFPGEELSSYDVACLLVHLDEAEQGEGMAGLGGLLVQERGAFAVAGFLLLMGSREGEEPLGVGDFLGEASDPVGVACLLVHPGEAEQGEGIEGIGGLLVQEFGGLTITGVLSHGSLRIEGCRATDGTTAQFGGMLDQIVRPLQPGALEGSGGQGN